MDKQVYRYSKHKSIDACATKVSFKKNRLVISIKPETKWSMHGQVEYTISVYED